MIANGTWRFSQAYLLHRWGSVCAGGCRLCVALSVCLCSKIYISMWFWNLSLTVLISYIQCVAIYIFTGLYHHLKCTQHMHESAVIMLECPIVSHLAFTTAHFCIFIFSVSKSSAFWWWTQHVWKVKNEKQNMINQSNLWRFPSFFDKC